MAVAEPGQLNLQELPSWGSRSVNCYRQSEKIGEGTYGQVFRAKDTGTGETVALKKIRMDNEKEGFPITAIREIKLLQKLNHDNIVKLKEIVTSPGPNKDEKGKPDEIFMVFEYMDHDLTGLTKRISTNKQKLTVPQIKCYMKQLLTGLHHCQVNQVLHRDIKGSNLLIDNQGMLKLADFGLARSCSFDHSANLTNRVITLWYRPPELILGSTKYGPAIDMWSVGCIFAELFYGEPILRGKDEAHQIYLIFALCGVPDDDNWPGVSELPCYDTYKPRRPIRRDFRYRFRNFDHSALQLIERMLTLDPSKRISAKDALDSAFFSSYPLPCDPKSLPKYEASHEFNVNYKQRPREGERKDVRPPPQSRYRSSGGGDRGHRFRPYDGRR